MNSFLQQTEYRFIAINLQQDRSVTIDINWKFIANSKVILTSFITGIKQQINFCYGKFAYN